MLTLYLVALATGGILVLLSAVGGGHHGAGAIDDVGVDHGDLAHGHDAVGHDSHGEHAHQVDASWLSFFGFRFWTYFSAFFGLSGTLLATFSSIHSVSAAFLSAGCGAASGFCASAIARFVSRRENTSSVAGDDLVGVEAVVLVAVRRDGPGKVRCTVRGEVLDLAAKSAGLTSMEVGARVIIMSVDDRRVFVRPRNDVIGTLENGERPVEEKGGG